MKFIPIEAVAAVIECKSSYPEDNIVTEWLNSIDRLETSQNSIVRIAGRIVYGSNELGEVDAPYLNTQTATRPIKILCYISGNDEFREEQQKEKKRFDIVLEANRNKEKLSILYSNSYQKLLDWYLYLNHSEENRDKIREFLEKNQEIDSRKPIFDIQKLEGLQLDALQVKPPENDKKASLLSFIFQFNQLLMLINNPIFFPHKAYVDMFNRFLEEEEKVGEKNKDIESQPKGEE